MTLSPKADVPTTGPNYNLGKEGSNCTYPSPGKTSGKPAGSADSSHSSLILMLGVPMTNISNMNLGGRGSS